MKSVQQVLQRKGTAVHTISPNATIFQALERMAVEDIGALVVIEDGVAVGLVSERDYARKVILRGKSSKDTPVREIMTRNVVCVASDERIDTCMALMTRHRVRHLPVMDGPRLAGIVSIGDAVKEIMEHQQSTISELEDYITGRPAPD